MKYWFLAAFFSVSWSSTPSKPSLTCDFERDMCDWRVDSSSSYIMWKRRRRRLRSRDSGPTGDHTTGNGYFMVMQTHRYAIARLALRSPFITSTTDTCLTFWYQMHGYDVGGLVVNKRVGNGDQELFRMFGPQGDRWYKAFVNTGSGNRFKLEIQASYYDGHMGLGDIAIDDVIFSYGGPCKPDAREVEKNSPHFDCDFEEDLCSWHSQGRKWRRTTIPSSKSTRNTPLQRNDGMTYIQASNQNEGSHHDGYTLLRSPTISIRKNGGCLSFWYKVSGNSANFFAVQKYDYGEGPRGRHAELFVAPAQSPVWTHQHVTLPFGYNMYIAFSVLFNVSGEGIVAIDDIALRPYGPCQEDNQKTLADKQKVLADKQKTVANKQEILADKQKTVVDKQKTLAAKQETLTDKQQTFADCDFETDLCQWHLKTNNNEGVWTRTKFPTLTSGTGPSRDHTSGAGYFLYLDGSSVKEADLYSPQLTVGPPGACLRFWYYMYGEDVNRLQLTLHKHGSASIPTLNERQLLWSLEGSQEARWIQRDVSIPIAENVHLVFTATQGYFPRCDIAIDDISISFDQICEKDVPRVKITPFTVQSDFSTPSTIEAAPANISVFQPTAIAMTGLALPNMTLKAMADPAYVYSRVEIVCSHNFEPIRYYWYKLKGEIYERIQGAEESSLVFEEIQFTDAGTYKCVIASEGFLTTESDTIGVRVESDPRPSPLLTTDSPTDPALIGVAITLTCGRQVARGVYHWHTDSPAFAFSPIPSNHSIVLKSTNQSYNGNYSCRISKDGYNTSRSNVLQIKIVPGKPCNDDLDCTGLEYLFRCIARRCLCNINTAIVGQECRQRPQPAIISTWPNFLEFYLGETFYLACNFGPVTPTSLIYTFIRSGSLLSREERHKTYNIFKITNATHEDSGEYQCYVTFNDVNSYRSRPIKVLVKESIDLNCNFSRGFCNWFHGNSPYAGNFTIENGRASPYNRGSHPGNADPYLWLDHTDGGQVHRATLRSPIIDQTTQDSCLSFRYRLHGAEVYSLTVWKYIFSPIWKEDVGEKLWTAIGDQDQMWLSQETTIPKGSNFYIQFEAIGDVAIDEIIFRYRCR